MTEQTVNMTNAQVVAACLKRHGVEYIFGQSNPITITHACIDIGIRQIGYRQENTGSYMAQAYGKATHKIPVITAQNGPAATLLVPGLFECQKAAMPIVAIVQQVSLPNFDKNAFQELDHEKLFAGCAKWVKTIFSEDRIEDYIDQAFAQAGSGRPGPVVLLFPTNIFYSPASKERKLFRSENLGTWPLDRPVADIDNIKEAARLLATAERPFVYAGGGTISASAQKELRILQDKFALPIGTTIMGKGSVDENHPLSMGVISYLSGKRGVGKFLRPLVENADVVLLIGNRTNQNGTDGWTLLPKNAKFIHIDVDPEEIGRNYESLRLTGDAKATLIELSKALDCLDLSFRASKRAEVESFIKEGKEKHLEAIQDIDNPPMDSNLVRPEKLMVELEKFLDDDSILVSDASFARAWIANYIKATGNREFHIPCGLAGLGWGFPMAMGAKIANPNRKVFCISGDGGFAHAWSELEACKRENIAVVHVVLNNTILGYQYHGEELNYKRHSNACDLYAVDYVALAQACGLTGLHLNKPGDIDAVLEEAFSANETVIIDMKTDPNAIPPITLFKSIE